MARYIAKLFIVVEADDRSEAADAFTGALSETLKYDGHIVEWSYAADTLSSLRRLSDTEPADLEDQDLCAAFTRAIDDSVPASVAG